MAPAVWRPTPAKAPSMVGADRDPLHVRDRRLHGVARRVAVPSPSWPSPFRPQQRTVASASSAQVWSPRLASDVAVVMPITAPGGSISLEVPRPSVPE